MDKDTRALFALLVVGGLAYWFYQRSFLPSSPLGAASGSSVPPQIANLPDVPESGNLSGVSDDGTADIVAPVDVGGSLLASTTLPIASNYGG